MRASNEFCGTQLIQALNEDIERELRIADEHIARALSANSLRKDAVQRNSSACAAAAMRHATALAAEVLHLGGVPPPFIPRDMIMFPRPASPRFRSVSPLPATAEDGE